MRKEHIRVERKVRWRSLWLRKELFPSVINDSGGDCPSKGRHVRESTVVYLGYHLDKKLGNCESVIEWKTSSGQFVSASCT